MRKLVIILCVMAFACSIPSVYGMSDTVERRVKALYYNQNLRRAKIPPLPSGQIRIKAPLNSLYCTQGFLHYPPEVEVQANLSNCYWCKSRFGIMGGKNIQWDSEENNFWFYADIDENSGEIVAVTAYGIGNCTHQREYVFILNRKIDGSYGKAGSNGFVIKAAGPGIDVDYYGADQDHGPKIKKADFAFIAQGTKNILRAANGAKIPLKYYLSFPEDVKADDTHQNLDRGKGIATVERASAPTLKREGAPEDEAGTAIDGESLVLPHEAMIRAAEKAREKNAEANPPATSQARPETDESASSTPEKESGPSIREIKKKNEPYTIVID